jgi:orotidine-5'-phosphate decarboxylase
MKSLIIALDLPDRDQATDLVDRLGESASFYKVGSQLFTREGPALVRDLKAREKRIFLDLKYHDIPNTVARAVEAAAELGVDILTLHAAGGTAMLEAARDAAGDDGPALVGVTLLTSFTAADVEAVWGKEIRSMRDEVARLAAVAAEAGLQGVVASALEVEALKRKHGPAFLVITPGIRPEGDLVGDQVRTATPADAVRAGSDFLVVGRPIYAAADPVEALDRVLAQIAQAEGQEAVH